MTKKSIIFQNKICKKKAFESDSNEKKSSKQDKKIKISKICCKHGFRISKISVLVKFGILQKVEILNEK